MLKEYYSPNDFTTGSDSERIQAAVDAAASTGCGKVIIPRVNALAQSFLWVIDETIRLPSDMTVILDNCHLRMADGVMRQMFCNSNAYTPEARTEAGEQRNIIIQGIGNALLDGGKETELNERTSGKNGLPRVNMNLTVFFQNVADFKLDGFTVRDQRWWAIECIFCRHGVISNLHFELVDRNSYGVWRNQDGIDLRVGCHDILIENISGETGDDTIALTALLKPTSHEYALTVPGRDTDIHDVIIRNVRAFPNQCSVVRLLNQQGNKIYNVLMDTIIDASEPGRTSRPQELLRIGEDAYYDTPEQRASHGDMYNITVRNIYSRSMTAVHVECTMRDFHASDIYVHHDGQYAFTCGRFTMERPLFIFIPERADEIPLNRILPQTDRRTSAENLLVENIYYTARADAEVFEPTVCGFHNVDAQNVVIRGIHCDSDVRRAAYYGENSGDIQVEE